MSGLHAAVLSQAILALLLFLKVPNRAAHLAAAGGVFLFMALTGFQPSIIRAGIMCIVYLFGKILGRQPDSPELARLVGVRDYRGQPLRGRRRGAAALILRDIRDFGFIPRV